jgi:TolA-binding protein
MKAAKAENREPRWAEATLGLGRFPAGAGGEVRIMSPPRTREDLVADGIFGGRVELQVGAPGAEPKPVLAAAGPVHDKAKSPPVVVVSGADKLVLRYAPAGREAVEVEADVVSEGRLELLDRTYSAQSPRINLGDSFYLQVTDYDQDKSDQLDTVRVAIQTSGGASSAIELIETLPHSGIFTAQITPTWKGPSAAPANTKAKAEGVQSPSAPDAGAALPVDFGETVRFTYQDPTTPEGTPRDIKAEGAIYDGDNGELSVFSKRFADPEMAVKVRFLWAEALFEQAKSYRELKNPEIAQARIMEGEQILNEALRDYPDTKLKDQGAFLLANLNEELAKDEPDEKKKIGLLEKAIVQYANILTQWPDGEYAPRAQFKKALCLELMGDFDRAAPEYVRLTYTWPEHTLVADATLRLANHYYKGGLFDVAGSIFRNFSRLRPEHDLAPKTLFLAGQCYLQQAAAYSEKTTDAAAARAAKQWEKAIEAFQLVVDNYPDRKDIRPEAMYWAGDVCFKTRDYKNSYRNFIRLTLDYPETEWAKRARGYLTDTTLARMGEE